MARSGDGIVLTQHKYALELILRLAYWVKPSKNPMEVNLTLTSVAYDDFVNKNYDDISLSNATFYKKVAFISL